MNTCSVDGCDIGARKKGMCDKHYRRVQRRGTLELTRQPPGSLVDIGDYFTININGVVKRQHVHIAETALGKPLPPNAEVHHVNGNGKDNTNSNLVVCPSRAYHMMIHLRQRALKQSGHADWRSCEHCKKWDATENMSSYSKRGGRTTVFYHKACAASTVARNKEKRRIKEQNGIHNSVEGSIAIGSDSISLAVT